jgi:anti-sigma-K factor RskA
MTDEPSNVSIAAAEYVLRLLPMDEAAAAQKRLESDPIFRAAVDDWTERLAVLANDVPPVAPPAEAWRRLSATLAASRPPVRPARRWGLRGTWLRTNGLRPLAAGLLVGIGLGAAATSIGLALLGGKPALPPPDQQASAGSPSVAVLYPEDGPARFVLAWRPDEQRLLVMPTATWGFRDRVPFLWLVAGDADPVFVATLGTEAPAAVDMTDALRGMTSPGVVFVVTAEPVGAAPKVGERGPIIAHGKLTVVAGLSSSL